MEACRSRPLNALKSNHLSHAEKKQEDFGKLRLLCFWQDPKKFPLPKNVVFHLSLTQKLQGVSVLTLMQEVIRQITRSKVLSSNAKLKN